MWRCGDGLGEGEGGEGHGGVQGVGVGLYDRRDGVKGGGLVVESIQHLLAHLQVQQEEEVQQVRGVRRRRMPGERGAGLGMGETIGALEGNR